MKEFGFCLVGTLIIVAEQLVVITRLLLLIAACFKLVLIICVLLQNFVNDVAISVSTAERHKYEKALSLVQSTECLPQVGWGDWVTEELMQKVLYFTSLLRELHAGGRTLN